MKNYIPLLFSLVCASSYAADVMEYTVLADIPYYSGVNGLLVGQPIGYITIEVTPTLTYPDIINAMQSAIGRRGILMFNNGLLDILMDQTDSRTIVTINGIAGNTIDQIKDRLKNLIERSFRFVLLTQ